MTDPITLTTLEAPHRPHDKSRTRVEARVAIPTAEEADENSTSTRRFTVNEITAGLPDDSREEEERLEERRLRDLRGRVKVARAVGSRSPELASILRRDGWMAAQVYARFGISEELFRRGASETEYERMSDDP